MLPKGVDPLFPNKRIVGYDAYGKPVYDMAATGLMYPIPDMRALSAAIYNDSALSIADKNADWTWYQVSAESRMRFIRTLRKATGHHDKTNPISQRDE